ncbi:MAG: hypothetical protein IPK76_04365 [Lewinellaceae bacterium]|nr:hypothetical protein [Lewinellaceae bacterium]
MSFGRKFRGVICLLALPFALAAQKEVTITLLNPSFEDVPKDSETPSGWYDCGKSGESPPDVQPGSFSVTKAPSHGNTYLGLVVRDNETWEGVAQRLSRPLEKDQCYEFTMDMCRAELYLSTSKVTGKDANYATPPNFGCTAVPDIAAKQNCCTKHRSSPTRAGWVTISASARKPAITRSFSLRRTTKRPCCFPTTVIS